MKIICVGRNYSEHIDELKKEKPEAPVIFLKPDTALLKNNAPFYYPSFSEEVHYEAEIIVKISKEGKNIAPEFSHKYFEEVGIGIDFTARDLQRKLQEKGLPWEISKSFNGSAAISHFMHKSTFTDIQNIHFSLYQNQLLKQSGNTSNMIFSFNEIISYISKFILLKPGDIIFSGTPSGVGPVKIGDVLTCFIEQQEMLRCEIK
ncbi:MAG: fumarylacetoacetate hydrolase family protein [Cytophagaceae bacterium]|nr:fumarylacetoacetate hydrolase family protein [Cytophagaceae bacterium]MDW8456564.1 fumarylacetoacetate hydrolase family protein [Cytophagaceae bacterium]